MMTLMMMMTTMTTRRDDDSCNSNDSESTQLLYLWLQLFFSFYECSHSNNYEKSPTPQNLHKKTGILPPTPFLQTLQDSHLIPEFHTSLQYFII